MSDQQIRDTLMRIQLADDPWAELTLWLKEQSARNDSLGGNQRTFICFVVYWLTVSDFPVGKGGR